MGQKISLFSFLSLIFLGIVFGLGHALSGPVAPALASERFPAEVRLDSPQAAGGSKLYLPMVNSNFDPSYVSPFGIIMYDNVNSAAGLAQMQAAGSRWVTTSLIWSAIEPNAPINGVHTYNWSSFDTKANNAKAAGMNVFVLFNGNPAWAAPLPGGPVDNIQNLVDFVTAMAERYDGDGVQDAPGSPVVNNWSFYAEPDNQNYGYALGGKGYWGHNGTGYAAMLYAIAPAIHTANPNARVLIGGLAYDSFKDEGCPDCPFARSFLNDTLQALNLNYGGAAHYIDAVAFHYYPISTARWPTIREKALEIRDIMAQNGVGALPLLAPEVGYWSPSVDEIGQAQMLVQTYVRAMSVGIEHVAWFQVFDGANDGANTGLFRGMNLSDPKPAYFAYQTLTRELLGGRYLGPFTSAGVEGYQFNMLDGRVKTVLWSAIHPSASASFAQTCLRLVSLQGNVQIVTDGSPGDLDHRVGEVSALVYFNEPVIAGVCA